MINTNPDPFSETHYLEANITKSPTVTTKYGRVVGIVLLVLGILCIGVGLIFSMSSTIIPVPFPVFPIILGLILSGSGFALLFIFSLKERKTTEQLITSLPIKDDIKTERLVPLSFIEDELKDAENILLEAERAIREFANFSLEFKDGDQSLFLDVLERLRSRFPGLRIGLSSLADSATIPEYRVSCLKLQADHLKEACFRCLKLINLNLQVRDHWTVISRLCEERGLMENETDMIFAPMEEIYRKILMFSKELFLKIETLDPEEDRDYSSMYKLFEDEIASKMQFLTENLLGLDLLMDQGKDSLRRRYDKLLHREENLREDVRSGFLCLDFFNPMITEQKKLRLANLLESRTVLSNAQSLPESFPLKKEITQLFNLVTAKTEERGKLFPEYKNLLSQSGEIYRAFLTENKKMRILKSLWKTPDITNDLNFIKWKMEDLDAQLQELKKESEPLFSYARLLSVNGLDVEWQEAKSMTAWVKMFKLIRRDCHLHFPEWTGVASSELSWLKEGNCLIDCAAIFWDRFGYVFQDRLAYGQVMEYWQEIVEDMTALENSDEVELYRQTITNQINTDYQSASQALKKLQNALQSYDELRGSEQSVISLFKKCQSFEQLMPLLQARFYIEKRIAGHRNCNEPYEDDLRSLLQLHIDLENDFDLTSEERNWFKSASYQDVFDVSVWMQGCQRYMEALIMQEFTMELEIGLVKNVPEKSIIEETRIRLINDAGSLLDDVGKVKKHFENLKCDQITTLWTSRMEKLQDILDQWGAHVFHL